jgi:hypothetical protein
VGRGGRGTGRMRQASPMHPHLRPLPPSVAVPRQAVPGQVAYGYWVRISKK